MKNQYLFYISKNYSFEILRPLQTAIAARGDEIAWFVEGSDVDLSNFRSDETVLASLQDAIDYHPAAVFVPGNQVPDFIPGLKVSVFHGLEWKKKGHFKIRGFFDLYCTHGPITTDRFKQLAKQHKNFHVRETGWPKLDPLFSTPPLNLDTELPVVLYAPTFSPSLSSAVECFDEIKRIASTREHYWLVKFHPKMRQDWIDLYKSIELDNFKVVESASVLPLLNTADVLLSDTSSIVGEVLLLGKPAVTYKNSQPGDYLIDIQSVAALENALSTALSKADELLAAIDKENLRIHPYNDGLSSQRILAAVDELTEKPYALARGKPLNLIRKYKLRKRLNYWRF